MLTETKMLLGTKERASDEMLEFIIEDSVNMVLAYCRLDILPYQLYGVIPQIAVSVFRASCERGEIKSITEGDRHIEYHTEILNNYRRRLEPFVNCRGKLPSEVVRNGE